jgi:hypothetical protein
LKIKSPLAWAIVAGPIVAVALGVWLARGHAPRQTQPLASGALESANVLLVTIDTLRVDRVGAYGSDRGLTPALDRLARNGLRFDRAYAHVPLTLPSHTTLMTGRYPPHNGVRDNGTFHLSDAPPTLAAALKGAGYRTGAFVGAFVLDARFGLNRGFDTYDDRMLGSSADLEVVQRPAEQVLAPAYDWITNVASGNVASGNVASGFSRTTTPAPANATAPKPVAPPAPASNFKDAFLAEIRKGKAVFYNTVVAQAQKIEVAGDKITFAFAPNQRALKEMFEQNRAWLESIAQQASGRRIAVSASHTDAAAPAPDADAAKAADKKNALREQALADAGVQAMLDVFPAEIRDVEEM